MRKPLNLKDLGKNPASVTLPKTPFERGMGADVSRPFPAQPPKVQDGPKREFPMNASQAPTIGGYDAKNEPPKINAKPWQIAAQNWRAKQAKEIGVGDITRDRTSSVAETTALVMSRRQELERQADPQTARIDAAQQALEALFAQRPELAEQAKLMFPNEAQLGVAGLAALLQPGRAFESLAQPFQFQQQEQARTQALNNQQFASDREEWGMMYQRAVSDVNSEYDFEQNRQANAIKNIQSFDDLTADLNSQDAQTQRTAMTVQGREQVAGMNNETQIAKTLIQVQGMMSREEFKSPEAVASRIYQSEVAKGTPPELATEIAQAAIRSDFYKNEQARAATLERLTLLPIKVQQGLADIEATQANIDYISARADYTRRLAQATNDDYALDLLKHGLAVQKFNESKRTNDRQATLTAAEKLLDARQAQAKILGDQLEKALQALTGAEDTPNEAEAQAEVARLRKDLAVVNKDIMAAAKAIEGLGFDAPKFSLGGLNGGKDYVTGMFGNTVNVGGAAASGGRFRPEQVKAATQNVVCRSGAQCAEGLTQALQNLGFDIPTMLGAEQTARWALNNGGRVVTDPQPGDIVWVEGPGYGGVQANGRRSGHHVELYAGNGMVWNRRTGRWTNDKANRHVNARRVRYIRLPE
jgi:hypothetical protein